jgi:predicted transcriptional regulator
MKVTTNNKEDIFELSEEQLNAVEEGQLQYKNGEILTEEQANKDIEEWLDNTIN